MLLTKDLIQDVEEKYIPMLKMVNIPDFTKCIAALSKLKMINIDDKQIKKYLLTWAKNKYRFFELLGNKLKRDEIIIFKKTREDLEVEFSNLMQKFPAYAPWLDYFSSVKENKIELFKISHIIRDWVEKAIPNFKFEGSFTLTYFFKHYLQAPDALVTEIGRIFENDEIEANYTLSIDPVDMMLASENPYNWTSCYRLEGGGHADGCLAATLDSSNLIVYVWTKEGKFKLMNTYSFSSIRYKKMRQWISISPKMTSIHFNTIYPGKHEYDKEFVKLFRLKAENIVATYLGVRDSWKKAEDISYSDCERENKYGYNEYTGEHVYVQSESEKEWWTVYDEDIFCPCGCRMRLPGSDECEDDGEWEYTGDGFNCENFYQQYWCDLADCYCSHECDRDECRYQSCWAWERAHPLCEIDEETECEHIEEYELDTYDGRVMCNSSRCAECPLYQEHFPEEEDEKPVEENNISFGSPRAEELTVIQDSQLNLLSTQPSVANTLTTSSPDFSWLTRECLKRADDTEYARNYFTPWTIDRNRPII